MAKKTPTVDTTTPALVPDAASVEVHNIVKQPSIVRFAMWLIGDTPLIVHAWSEKAKRDMLSKQVQEIKPEGRQARDPQEDFINSLYDMGNGYYGFPVTAVKKAMWSVAHVQRGIIKSDVLPGIWLDHQVVRVRPATAGAVCDMPLVRIIAEKPEMREDMVRVGTGLRKTATLAYRAQFFPWALKVTGRINVDLISEEALANLALWSGMEAGIGDWRTEKTGTFGAYHPASAEESESWEKYVAGKASIPFPDNYITAEAAD